MSTGNALGLRRMISDLGDVLRRARLVYLRILGVEIGTGCMISLGAKLDVRRGKTVIGNNCTITYGCVILSHDASAKRISEDDDGAGTVRIGNGVFIGVNSVVLRNVRIGDNSVIGAGSVVTSDIPANVVAFGNPARIRRRIGRGGDEVIREAER